MKFKTLLFEHIPFENCWKKPRFVIDSTWHVLSMCIRRLMGSTDQADPSCFYFKIS